MALLSVSVHEAANSVPFPHNYDALQHVLIYLILFLYKLSTLLRI